MEKRKFNQTGHDYFALGEIYRRTDKFAKALDCYIKAKNNGYFIPELCFRYLQVLKKYNKCLDEIIKVKMDISRANRLNVDLNTMIGLTFKLSKLEDRISM